MLLRDCFVAGRRTISVDALRLGAWCWTLTAASAPAALTRVLIVWCHSTSKTQTIPNGVYTYENPGIDDSGRRVAALQTPGRQPKDRRTRCRREECQGFFAKASLRKVPSAECCVLRRSARTLILAVAERHSDSALSTFNFIVRCARMRDIPSHGPIRTCLKTFSLSSTSLAIPTG
jgi:hypothetical protein